MRASLVVAAAEQGSDTANFKVRRASTAVELLHLASLAHDDLIDSGTIRRGEPTAGVVYGQRAAGFAGAWLFAVAVEQIAECGPTALAAFEQTARSICAGGIAEMCRAGDTNRTVDDYFAVVEQKTASMIALAARLGAELSGCSAPVVSQVREFGIQLGFAYQIWDDLVDLFTDSELRGEDAVNDLRQGIYALPVIFAIEERPELHDGLRRIFRGDGEQESIDEMIHATNGVTRALAVADECVARAASSVAGLPRPELMNQLLERTRSRFLGLLV